MSRSFSVTDLTVVQYMTFSNVGQIPAGYPAVSFDQLMSSVELPCGEEGVALLEASDLHRDLFVAALTNAQSQGIRVLLTYCTLPVAFGGPDLRVGYTVFGFENVVAATRPELRRLKPSFANLVRNFGPCDVILLSEENATTTIANIVPESVFADPMEASLYAAIHRDRRDKGPDASQLRDLMTEYLCEVLRNAHHAE